MMGYYYDGFWGFGWIFMIIFWFIIIFGIIAIIKSFSGSDHRENHGNSALDILKERYAKGEMSKEEYESKKKDLI